MVSYYNTLTYPQKHSGYPPVQSWFSPNYHPTSNHQLISDIDAGHHQSVYYNPHHVFPQGPTIDWHNHENFPNQHSHHHHHSHQSQISGGHTAASHHELSSPNHGGNNGQGNTNGNGGSSIHLTDITGNNSEPSSSHGGEGGGSSGRSGVGGIGVNGNNGMLPISPALTKTELSSPTSDLTSLHLQISHHHHHHQQNKNHRSGLVKSPYYDWMKKPPYSTQNSSGKTRTKDKYRVVYTDFQRLELEKEYLTSRYITIRRKTELAQALQLSERQVKIWFQNRRAKERKQNKKRDESDTYAHSTSDSTGHIGESKTKIESAANLSHSLHQMPMGMSSLNLHHHPALQSGHLTISPVHHAHHSPVSVQSLPMQ